MTDALRWTKEWAGHYTALGRRGAYVADRRKTGWSLIERPVIEVAGVRVGDPGAHARSEHRIPTLAIVKTAAAHMESGMDLARAVAQAFTDDAERTRVAFEAATLAALPDMSPDGTRMLGVGGGGPVSAHAVRQMQPWADALAAHFAVPAPIVEPAEGWGPVRLGSYLRQDEAGVIALNWIYLDTVSMLHTFVHEFAHHLEHERGTYRGTDAAAAHGPRFIAVWDEVRAACAAVRGVSG